MTIADDVDLTGMVIERSEGLGSPALAEEEASTSDGSKDGDPAPASPPAEAPESPEPGDAPEQQTEQPQPDAESDPEPQSAQKRIARLTRKLGDATRVADALRREVEALRANVVETVEPPKADGLTRADVERLAAEIVERRMRELAEQETLSEQSRAAANLYQAGANKYQDFSDIVASFEQEFGQTIRGRPAFAQAMLAIPNGEEVYYRLAKDPEAAERLLTLPDVSIGIEIGRMSRAAEAPPTGRRPQSDAISMAPRPVAPVPGRGGATIDLMSPNLPSDTFIEAFTKEVKERWKRNG